MSDHNFKWYRGVLTPLADGIYTEAFYPTPKRGTGSQHVFFTQVEITSSQRKVVVASRLEQNAVRMMSQDLAKRCILPVAKASKAEAVILNSLTEKLKL